jgi:hypothetical protein
METDPAVNVTPTPCQLPFTWVVLLIDCATIDEFPVIAIAPLTFTVEPPPIVNVAPPCTLKFVTLYVAVGQLVLVVMTTFPEGAWAETAGETLRTTKATCSNLERTERNVDMRVLLSSEAN